VLRGEDSNLQPYPYSLPSLSQGRGTISYPSPKKEEGFGCIVSEPSRPKLLVQRRARLRVTLIIEGFPINPPKLYAKEGQFSQFSSWGFPQELLRNHRDPRYHCATAEYISHFWVTFKELPNYTVPLHKIPAVQPNIRLCTPAIEILIEKTPNS
jgi:hypothetical protein